MGTIILETIIHEIFEFEEIKNESNVKMCWLSTWNKEIDPPTYILQDNKTWIFINQSDKGSNLYQKIEGYELPSDLIW